MCDRRTVPHAVVACAVLVTACAIACGTTGVPNGTGDGGASGSGASSASNDAGSSLSNGEIDEAGSDVADATSPGFDAASYFDDAGNCTANVIISAPCPADGLRCGDCSCGSSDRGLVWSCLFPP